MSEYTNNYSQNRRKDKRLGTTKKDIATSAHLKEVRKAINECANGIALEHGLSNETAQRIVTLVYEDKDAVIELPIRINFIINTLKRYGYDEAAATQIIDSNFSLLRQEPISLMHSLSIANKYGFDEDLLTNNNAYPSVNEKELYALSEKLVSDGVEPTLETLSKLCMQVRNNNKMADLIEAYPLAKSRIYTLRTLYERDMKNKTLIKTK